LPDTVPRETLPSTFKLYATKEYLVAINIPFIISGILLGKEFCLFLGLTTEQLSQTFSLDAQVILSWLFSILFAVVFRVIPAKFSVVAGKWITVT
jgi:hypothetical protein